MQEDTCTEHERKADDLKAWIDTLPTVKLGQLWKWIMLEWASRPIETHRTDYQEHPR